MKRLTTFLLTLLLFTLGAMAQTVVHECSADLSDWSLATSTETFQVNTGWSGILGDGTTPNWIEYWKNNNNSTATLTNNTISHTQLTGLDNGYYTVSIFARACKEGSSTAITSGTTFFNANDATVDITTGSLTSATAYTEGAEAAGTYNLLAQVTDGTLNINFTLTGVNYNWFVFKDLVVTYQGTEAPTLSYVEGDMNADVEAAMKAAVDAWNNSLTDNSLFEAAEAAIEAAEASIEQYAEIAELVAKLDAAGAAVWAESASGQAYAAKTLATSDDISTDMSAAQKAQTTAGSDMTYALLNSGAWAADQGNGPGTCPSLTTATETYNTSNYAVGKVLYKTIEGLTPGTYEVSFYVQANAANVTGLTSGDGIAQAYANDGTPVDVTVGTVTNLGNEWPEGSLVTITCTVESDGVLEFGLQNVAAGGNWYVAEAYGLTMLTGEEPVVDGNDNDYEIGDEIDWHNFKGTVAGTNLFVNGGFNNGVEGWTAGNGYTDPLSTEGEGAPTITAEGGYNGGAYVTLAATGAANATTPTQAIAVEPGKSYLLVGYTKYSGSDSDLPDSRYSALFVMDSETAERSHLEGTTSYSDDLVQLQIENTGEWIKTEGVFTVPAENEDGTFSYVGMRMNWSTASYDGLQLYELDGEFTFPEDADYAIDDEVTVDDVTYVVTGENLFVNGGFNERTTGWTYGNTYTEWLYPYNVTYSTDGGYNDGPFITSKGGGSSANTTPSQPIAVEAGKSYLFVGYTNGTAPSNDNLKYNALFNIKIGDEDALAEDGVITQMNWDNGEEELNGWTKTEAVFTADEDHPYVGVRFAWCPGASFDGFQIYEVEAADVEPEPEAIGGDYLVMNEDGLYLGGGLAWGTQSTIIAKPQFIGFELQENGTYHLDSHQYNSASDHYLGSNLYFDNGTPVDWTVAEVDGGYTIYGNGGYLTSNGFQEVVTVSETPYVWTLVTMDDVVASMDEATAEAPVDVTALIAAPEMKRNSNTSYYPTWTVTGYDGTGTPSNYAFGDGNGAVANCAESYHSTNGFNFSQEITLPLAGYYTLSAQGFYRDDYTDGTTPVLPVMYAGEESVEFPEIIRTDEYLGVADNMANAYQEFLLGLHPIDAITITTETDGETVTIGFKGEDTNLWNIMGELTLLYSGSEAIEPEPEVTGTYVFVAEEWVASDNSRVTADNITYNDDNTITVVASGTNNIALGNNPSQYWTDTNHDVTTADYTISEDQCYFVVIGYDLSTADGDSYWWWMNGINDQTVNQGQIAPDEVYELSDGQVMFVWDITSYITNNMTVGEDGLITLDGVTCFGLTSVADDHSATITDINFYTKDQVTAITGGTATLIENVETAGTELAKEGIYTLSGVRLNKITKSGIYIVDGKKMFVK